MKIAILLLGISCIGLGISVILQAHQIRDLMNTEADTRKQLQQLQQLLKKLNR